MESIRRITCVLLIWVLVNFPALLLAGEWKFATPMPLGHFAGDATLGLDGRIYVMGGGNSRWTSDGRYSNLCYDPAADRWEYLLPVPGRIQTNDVFVFVEPGKWKRVPKAAAGSVTGITRNTDFDREGDGVAVVTGKDGRIYWLGGRGKQLGRGEDVVLPFDPASGQWPAASSERVWYSSSASRILTILQTDMPPMLERRYYHAAVVTSDGAIYAIGGRQREMVAGPHGNEDGQKVFALDSMERWDSETRKWEFKAPLPVKRIAFAAAVGARDLIYVFGGVAGTLQARTDPILATTEVYDPKTDRWSQRKPMPGPRYGHKAVYAADGRFYVLGGGEEHRSPPLRDVLIYDPAKDSWQKGPSLQTPRDLLMAVATPEGKIYALGGTDRGAYPTAATINNMFFDGSQKFYAGRTLETVEVLQVERRPRSE